MNRFSVAYDNHIIKKIFDCGIAIGISFLLNATGLRAEQNDEVALSKTQVKHDPVVFSENYIGVFAAVNTPANRTADKFSQGSTQLALSYSHLYDQSWILNLSLHYRQFLDDDANAELDIFSFKHDSSKIVRVYHPFYFFFGGGFAVLIPSRESNFPVQKDQEYTQEIGVGVHSGLIWAQHTRHLIFAKIERWRGTLTSKLQGLEISYGYSFGF